LNAYKGRRAALAKQTERIDTLTVGPEDQVLVTATPKTIKEVNTAYSSGMACSAKEAL
jgi:hypothetical protein